MEKEKFALYVHNYIKLVSLYLNKKEASDFVIDNKILSFFVKLSKAHSLSAFLFKAIEGSKVKIDEEVLLKLEQPYLLNARKVASFNKERKELYQYLDENGIDYLPLKGIVIKDYYPDQRPGGLRGLRYRLQRPLYVRCHSRPVLRVLRLR